MSTAILIAHQVLLNTVCSSHSSLPPSPKTYASLGQTKVVGCTAPFTTGCCLACQLHLQLMDINTIRQPINPSTIALHRSKEPCVAGATPSAAAITRLCGGCDSIYIKVRIVHARPQQPILPATYADIPVLLHISHPHQPPIFLKEGQLDRWCNSAQQLLCPLFVGAGGKPAYICLRDPMIFGTSTE